MKKNSGINEQQKKTKRLLRLTSLLVLAGAILFIYLLMKPNLSISSSGETGGITEVEDKSDIVENGIHVRTGFIAAEGYMTVVNNCTSCHSSKLVIQNRMNTERWNATIKWMQETQNLWDLGGNQEIIVNYLVTNYPPVDSGRRASLANIEWYELKD